ncbi:MAG: DUF4340 domain-containing protein [Verrucomicrobia bacterium]|jgi:hypothetical protein|nr:DUF4340 domain-containing protein [Verrucomicrobiota bacterium]
MRFKFTLFLLALNVVTLGLIVYLNNQTDRASGPGGGLSGQIGRELVDADRIELKGRGLDSPRIIERTGSDWSLIEPMQWSANYFAISRILNQLQFLEEEASFSIDEIERTGQSLADYGLEDPVLDLTIAEGSKALTISIGTLTEIGNNIYLLGPDRDEIFVVSRKVIDGLLVDLNDLRNREIFNIPVFEVGALSLQIRSESAADNSFLKVRLARNNGNWSFEAPVAAGADPALVDNTINTLTAAKVRRFIEDPERNLESFGLEEPFMRVTIDGNNRQQTLMVGDEDPEGEGPAHYFAKLEENPVVFTVPARPFDLLREAQEALRERDFMRFDATQLSSVNIAGASRTIRLQKLEADGWQVLESADGSEIQTRRADPQIIQELIDSLAELRATEFVSDNPSPADEHLLGFSEPRRTVELRFNESEPLILSLAHPEDENEALYAKTNRADFIYAVDRRATLDALPLNTLHYRNRTLDTLPKAARIQRLRLTDLGTGADFVDLQLDDDEADWTQRLAGMDTDRADLIRSLLSNLRQFKVDRYLLDRYADAYPLDAAKTLPWAIRLSASIVLPGGETDRVETLEYVFTERLSGTMQIGGSEKQNSIFEIPQPLIDTLYELTDEMELPPEMKEAPIPAPETIPPVEEPEPIAPDSTE